jgi:Secretion system C-terminal sorting domain
MKKIIYTLTFCITSLITQYATAQLTQYRTVASGAWNALPSWERSADAGTTWAATTGTNLPTTNQKAIIQNGNTITLDASKNPQNVTINAGGRLSGTLATNTNAVRLGSGTAGVGGIIGVLQNDGILGGIGVSDLMPVEINQTASLVTIQGTGSANVGRIRFNGPNNNYPASTAAGKTNDANLIIDQDMNLYFTNNYILSAPGSTVAATDVLILTINAGKTVKIVAADGYFHNNNGTGNYTYNINGTLDLSNSTSTTAVTQINPLAGTTSINVSGIIKTGVVFNSVPPIGSVANLTIKNGGQVDASLATTMNFVNNAWVIEGTGILKRKVLGDGTAIVYSTTTATTTNNNVSINRTDATPTVYSVNVSNTITNAGPNPTKQVNKQWNINCLGTPSSNDVLKLSWTTADQTAGFLPAGTVNVCHWNGTTYDIIAANVTGTGTLSDPYVATTTAPVTAYSPFIISNPGAPVPVTLLSFNVKENVLGVNVIWNTTNEVNVDKYEIEKSLDGKKFKKTGEVFANNNSNNNEYNYIDASLSSGLIYYRLKSVDVDGQFKYSIIVTINKKIKTGIQVYPNPTKEYITIVTEKTNTQKILRIVNTNGQLVKQIDIASGAIQTKIYVGNLPIGNYQIVSGNKQEKGASFIIQ